MRQLCLVSLFGLASVARADLAMCRQAYQKDLRQCYELVTSARAAVDSSDESYRASVSTNAGPRALGQTMRNAGLSGVETWSSAQTKCEDLKKDCDTKCQVGDAGAADLKSKCDKEFEKYASYIDEGLGKSQQAVQAGASTMTSSYDLASDEQAQQARDVASRASDVEPESQQYVQKTGDNSYTLVGRDATGRAITENSWVMKKNIPNVEKMIKQCNDAVCSVDVYKNKYD